jgi:L-serine dehydratase
MVLELDQEIPEEALTWLSKLEGVNKVTYYSLK